MVAACIALVAGALAARADGAERVTVATTARATFYTLPLAIAERLGYFRDEDLAVEVVEFAGGSKVLQAVVGGSADFGMGGFEHVLTVQAKQGTPLKAVAATIRRPGVVIGVVASRVPNYAGPSDLKGRPVGVSAPGSQTHVILARWLSTAGLKTTDVGVVGLGAPATARAAAEQGKVDALAYVDPVMSRLEDEGTVRVVADTRIEDGARRLAGGEILAGVLYVSDDYAQRHPKTVQGCVNALARALAWLAKATPEQVADAVPPEFVGPDRAGYVRSFARFRGAIALDPVMTPTQVDNSIPFAALLVPEIRVESVRERPWVDNRYATRAVERLRAP